MVSKTCVHTLILVLASSSLSPGVGAESLQERRERIDKMTAVEKEALQRKETRFRSLSPEEQQRLRSMHSEVTQAPDGAELQQIMVRYYAWLRTLPPGQRKDILSLPPDERLTRIKKILEIQSIERFKRLARTKLEDRDVPVIKAWIDDFMERHKDELIAALPEQQRMQIEDNRRPGHPGGGWKFFAMGVLLQGDGKVSLSPLAIPEEIADLKKKLSPSARDLLENETDPDRQTLMIHSWVQAAQFSDFVRRYMKPVNNDELMRFLQEEASDVEREELEGLTAEQARREAERMYYAHEMKKNWEKNRGRSGSGFNRPQN